MSERLDKILAESGLALRTDRTAVPNTISYSEAERIERARRERITKIWTEKGVLPLLTEIATALKSSQLTIDEFRCYLRFNQTGSESTEGAFSYDYITIHVEAESFKVAGTFGGFSEKRNPNGGRLNINGKIVGRDGDLDKVLANALAHPSHYEINTETYQSNY